MTSQSNIDIGTALTKPRQNRGAGDSPLRRINDTSILALPSIRSPRLPGRAMPSLYVAARACPCLPVPALGWPAIPRLY